MEEVILNKLNKINDFVHEQLKGFQLHIFTYCCISRLANNLANRVAKGFSLVWNLECIGKTPDQKNDFEQSCSVPHQCNFLRWLCSCSESPKIFVHREHWPCQLVFLTAGYDGMKMVLYIYLLFLCLFLYLWLQVIHFFCHHSKACITSRREINSQWLIAVA